MTKEEIDRKLEQEARSILESASRDQSERVFYKISDVNLINELMRDFSMYHHDIQHVINYNGLVVFIMEAERTITRRKQGNLYNGKGGIAGVP